MKHIYTLLLAILMLGGINLRAQNTGDYRSSTTGEWSSAATWETYDGASWQPASVAPDGANSGLITIQSPMTVSITTTVPVTADELVIESGATLYIAETDFDVLNGAGEDLVCQGTLYTQEGTITNSGVVRFASGSTFGWGFNSVLSGAGTYTLDAGSAVDFAATGNRTIEADFVNNTTIDFNNIGFGNALTIDNSAVFLNNGTVIFSNNADLATTLGGTFQNDGTLEVTNFATLTITADLIFNGGSSSTFHIINGSVAFISTTHNFGGTLIIDSGANLAGANTVSFSGHTITNNGSVFLDLLKLTGSSTQLSDGTGTIQYLEIDGAGLNLGNNLTISQSLVLTQGLITTNGYRLILSSSATITGGNDNSHAIGNLQQQVNYQDLKVYPLGDGTHYLPVEVTPDDDADVTISLFSGDHPSIGSSTINPNQSCNLHWRIEQANPMSGTLNCVFNFDASHLDPLTDPMLLGAYAYAGGSWSSLSVNENASGNIDLVIDDLNPTTVRDIQLGLEFDYSTWAFYSTNTGAWEDVANWEVYNVGTGLFEPAPHVPDGFNSGAITIRNGHTIIINNNIPASADEMTIEAGAQVFVGLGGLTILDGYDLDLSVHGVLELSASTLINEGRIEVDGTFQWAADGLLGGPGDLTLLDGCSFINATDGFLYLESTLFNQASITRPSLQIYIQAGAEFRNDNELNLINGMYLGSSNPPGGIFRNTGRLNVNSPSTTCTITSDVHFINVGTIHVQDGTLALYESAGEYGGNLKVDAAGIVDGTAQIAFTGDTVQVDGAINLPLLNMNGAALQRLGGTGSINNLRVDAASGVELIGNATVLQTLDLVNGVVQTGAHRVVLGSGSTVTNASAASYVNGNVERVFSSPGYLEYPVGDASFYLPVTLDPSFTVGGSVVVRTDPGDHPDISNSMIDPNKSVNRNWTITNVSLTFSECDVLFNWNALDVDGPASTTSFILAKKDGSWTYPPVSVDPGTSLSVLDLTSFSEFQIGEAATIPSYRSATSGNWSSVGTWESNDGSGWQPASVVPDGSNSASINILNGHTVSINGGDRISADELVVDLGGVLELTTGSLTLLDGTGDDLQVNGTMTLADSLIVNGAARIQTTGTLELQNNTTLAGAGTVTFVSGSTINDGPGLSNINFGAGIQVYNNSEVTLSSTGLDFGPGAMLENNGTINLNGTILYLTNYYFAGNSFGEAYINNTASGTVHFNTHAQLEPGIVLTNNGTIHISPNNDLEFQAVQPVQGGFYWIEDGELRDGASYTPNIDFTFAGDSIRITGIGEISMHRLIMSGSSPQTIQGDGRIHALEIDQVSYSGVTAPDYLKIGSISGGNDDQLRLTRGILNTGSSVLTIESTALVYGGDINSYVEGELAIGFPEGNNTRVYPIGRAPAGFLPATVTIDNSGQGSTSFIVATYNSDISNLTGSGIDPIKSLNRHWRIATVSGGFNTAEVSFHYPLTELDAGVNTANFIARLVDINDIWSSVTLTSVTNDSLTISLTPANEPFDQVQFGEPVACFVNIPDATFKSYLLANPAINTNSNGEIECSEAAAFTGGIDVNNMNIADLTGIEAFTGLTSLRCYSNLLTGTLDVSNSPNLTELLAYYNQLTSVNISNNPVLADMNIEGNQLTTIDLSGAPGLLNVNVGANQLTALDISSNTALQGLAAFANQLT
ncbi:MAG: hypothetical protein KA193_12850, partial [Bacteroidia bacterium]|nr:hypothetical protein [Bacteroidia bacterium]